MIADLESQKIFVKPIVTEVKPAGEFYAAEDYHKNYYQNHPDQAYCRGVINPKLAKLKEKFGYRLKQFYEKSFYHSRLGRPSGRTIA